MRKYTRPYVGLAKDGGREIFRSVTTPTEAEYGERFFAVIGPFRTTRGALFMKDHGAGNPHCQHVADAERLAKSLHQ